MRIHDGIKPYKCTICGVAFTTHGHLGDHVRSHTGERPFKCDYCYASFIRSSTLKTHIRRHNVNIEDGTPVNYKLIDRSIVQASERDYLRRRKMKSLEK